MEEDGSPSGISTPGVSVDSSIGGVGMGVLEDDTALKEFKFSLHPRPSMYLFKALGPCLPTWK